MAKPDEKPTTPEVKPDPQPGEDYPLEHEKSQGQKDDERAVPGPAPIPWGAADVEHMQGMGVEPSHPAVAEGVTPDVGIFNYDTYNRAQMAIAAVSAGILTKEEAKPYVLAGLGKAPDTDKK